MKKSKIYTKTGDNGITSLADGEKIAKSSLQLETYGTIDEVSSHVGVALTLIEEDEYLERVLTFVSHRLYNCSSILANTKQSEKLHISMSDIEFLEQSIDFFDSKCPTLNGFVLCGGSKLSASLHVCRTVVRRAERLLYRLEEQCSGSQEMKMFINRLSDLFFASARYANMKSSETEKYWDPNLSS